MKKNLVLVITTLLVMSGVQLFAQDFINGFKWSVYDDTANGGSSVINMNSAMEKIGGKEVHVVTLTGKVTTKYQYGFAGVAVDPDEATLQALKIGKGISFKTIGDGKQYRVRIETSDITDYDYYGKVFYAPKDSKPKEVVVPYSSLTQEGWGAKKKFNPENIVKISFQTVGQPISSFEFKIIDLKPMK